MYTCRERPILMTAENAQRCHDRQKVQTRRLATSPEEIETLVTFDGRYAHFTIRGLRPLVIVECPYGMVGATLWVREASWIWGRWLPNGLTTTGRRKFRFREAIERRVTFQKPTTGTLKKKGNCHWGWVRRPSIFLPRWACRTWLELTDVRVEHLGQITEDDAKAEGVESIEAFRALWQSIHNTWEPETWVWCLSFRRAPVTRC